MIHHKNIIRYFLVILIVSILCFHKLFCTNKQIISGIIIDKSSHEKLYSTYVIINDQIEGISDTSGRFTVHISSGDTLRFSHLGYQSDKIIVTDSLINQSTPIIFYLDIKYHSIDEVTIFPFNDYNSFKTAVLNKTPTSEQVNSRENLTLTKRQIINGVIPKYDPEMNFRSDMRQIRQKNEKMPPMLTLFSSNGQKGISGFIKYRRLRKKVNKVKW